MPCQVCVGALIHSVRDDKGKPGKVTGAGNQSAREWSEPLRGSAVDVGAGGSYPATGSGGSTGSGQRTSGQQEPRRPPLVGASGAGRGMGASSAAESLHREAASVSRKLREGVVVSPVTPNNSLVDSVIA